MWDRLVKRLCSSHAWLTMNYIRCHDQICEYFKFILQGNFKKSLYHNIHLHTLQNKFLLSISNLSSCSLFGILFYKLSQLWALLTDRRPFQSIPDYWSNEKTRFRLYIVYTSINNVCELFYCSVNISSWNCRLKIYCQASTSEQNTC